MAMTVLIVDDSAMIRRQVKRALTEAGSEFDVIEAEDGVVALAMLDARSETAVVVCDVNMPRMNGLDFLAAARSDARFKALPFIMLTTEAQPDLVARAKALDAKGWLLKPFKPELMLAAIRKLATTKAA